jgi:CBS domain-containing protein
MKVSNLITNKPVHTISPNASIQELVEKLTALKVGALVVSQDGKKIDGIISERDVVAAMPSQLHRFDSLHVKDLMTSQVEVAFENSLVEELMAIMTQKRIRHVPIVDGSNNLISIISIGDIVKAHITELDDERHALIDYVHNPR